MFTCLLCGLGNPLAGARFCSNCGPGANWPQAEVDQPERVQAYWVSLRELMLEPDHDEAAIGEFSLVIRARLKVSYRRHGELMAAISAQQAGAQQVSAFSLEFDENLHDSVAGQDTQLRFRLSNNSDKELLKISITWDDPETPEPLDFAIKGARFLRPGEKVVVSGTYVFARSGPKNIADMRVTVSDPALQLATFMVAPFSFKVGAGPQPPGLPQDTSPRWRILRRTLLLDDAIPQAAEPATPLGSDATPPAVTLPLPAVPAAAQAADGGDELLEHARRFVEVLAGLTRLLPSTSERSRLTLGQDMPRPLLETFAKSVGEARPTHLLAIFQDDPQQGNAPAATYVSRQGLTVHPGSGAAKGDPPRFYQWGQLWPNGLRFFKQRFGTQAFVVAFGVEASGTAWPGLRFDLRRYQGAESIDDCVDRASRVLDELCTIAPLPEDTQPRLLSQPRQGVETVPGESAIEIGGLSYRGKHLNGVPHGKGVLIWPDGKTLEARFEDGKISGTGTLNLASGDRVEGPFEGHEPSGLCRQISQDGREHWVLYLRGRVLAVGPFDRVRSPAFCPDGDYVGQVANGVPHGYGVFRKGHGSIYIGGVRYGTPVKLSEVFYGAPAKQDSRQQREPVTGYRWKRVTRGDLSELWKPPQAIGEIKMVMISPGRFRMGDLTGRGYDEERPAREVQVTRRFWLAAEPVTRAQWRILMGEAPPSSMNQEPDELLPATSLSWLDAVAFCNALSRALGLRRAYELTNVRGRPGTLDFEAEVEWKGLYHEGVRLPTEAEWEYACRAGTTTEFHLGDTEAELHQSGWFAKNSNARLQRVGLKRPNRWGLLDMHGNNWEWCNDHFAAYGHEAVADPVGPDSGRNRVARGGAYDNKARMVRSAARKGVSPDTRLDTLGFRVACSLL